MGKSVIYVFKELAEQGYFRYFKWWSMFIMTMQTLCLVKVMTGTFDNYSILSGVIHTFVWYVLMIIGFIVDWRVKKRWF